MANTIKEYMKRTTIADDVEIELIGGMKMQNDKPLNCPFCDKKLKRIKNGYEHKSSQCVLSSFILTDVEIPKWNARKPMERIVEQLEDKMLTSSSASTEAIIGMCGVSATYYNGEYEAYKKAIEIVKGGVDNAG